MAEFRLAKYDTPNFHQGVLTYRDRTVAVVGTRYYGRMALAEPRVIEPPNGVGSVSCLPLEFLDDPDLVAVLTDLAAQTKYRVWAKAELDGPFDASAWPEMSANDIRYWRPDTLGAALFNWWD
ncbi:hypothetical protein [Lentzea sp. NPDC051838]|uniref:hypothetical protein n=1 Tax=Lentzea sp. NPDC051838 TaxID=3154849 RepID=UPI003418443B